MSIQAIPTWSNGIKYRSRLEAKWSIWLTAMDLPYEYEREGYVVDGRPYLCDFWIPYEAGEPGWGFWMEVKPSDYYMSEADVALYDGMARETGHRVYVVTGNPRPREQRVSVFQHYHNGTPGRVPWGTGSIAVDLKIAWSGKTNQFEVAQDNGIGIWCEQLLEWLPFPDKRYSPLGGRERLTAAFQAAGEARFEHGEKPQMPARVSKAEKLPEIDMTTLAMKMAAKRKELGL